jgi:hypothetical protein
MKKRHRVKAEFRIKSVLGHHVAHDRQRSAPSLALPDQ